MRSTAIFILSQLAAGAFASPCKNQCNADNCLRAVRASSHAPGPSSATADCSSFLQKTVTPCAATTTVTQHVTFTNSPVDVTLTTNVPVTKVFTVTDLETVVVTTIKDTATVIQPTLVVKTDTIFNVITSTLAPVLRARDIAVKPLPTMPSLNADVKVRAVATTPPAATTPSARGFDTSAPPSSATPTSAGTCAATTNSPSAVPTYASACSGTVRYSSACSCAGVTGSTTTLAQTTVTVTTTSTVQTTPTATIIAPVTTQVPVTAVQTVTVPTAFETTDATLVIPSAYTTVVTVPVTTTVSVQPACTTAYHFVAYSGSYSGQFVNGGEPPANQVSYGFVSFTSSPTGATKYVIRSNSRVYADDVYSWVTRSGQFYYVLEMTDNSLATYQIAPIFCSIDPDNLGNVAGSVGTLQCTSGGSVIKLLSSSQTGNNLAQSPNGSDGTAVNLAAVPVCL